ncbi:hypothetical protein LBMAG42_48690 [Deltaproteobacteria bacterium]|nr:hypothetical protein LBMAG42_48690 [Deltaproteobacteria bacterium]
MILALLACVAMEDTAAPADSGEGTLDLRLNEGDYTAGDVELWGPDVVIEPGEDVMHCIAGTYSGGDIGIHGLTTWQNKFGHHLQFFGLAAGTVDYADGATFACGTGTAFDMTDTTPVGIPTAVWIGDEQTIDTGLDEGMAFAFDAGERYLLQAHYVNTGAEAIRAHDLVVFDTLDPDTEVSTWAAPVILNNANIELPPAQAASMSFDCPVAADNVGDGVHVLFVNGHMHEWGTSLRVSQLRDDETRVLNDVPTWEPVFRDSPPTTAYAAGELDFLPGDTLRTECNWFNETDAAINFPHEMCDGVAIGYPLKTTWICDSDTGMNP